MDPVRHTLDISTVHDAAFEEDLLLTGHPLSPLQMGGDPDMLLDEYDAVDERPEVAIIHPDDSAEDADSEPLATDCMYGRIALLLS